MELYDDVEKKEKSKLPMIIGICISVLIVLIIVIMCVIVYLRSIVFTIKLDGEAKDKLEEVFYIKEEKNTKNIYVQIRKIASFFNYEDYNGDYKSKSEDKTKCYVLNQDEVAMFTKDTNTLVKLRGDSDYEYITLDEDVFEKDGELYTTIEGIEQAYNVLFECDLEKNKIDIYTMEYLNQLYAKKLGINGENQGISEIFSDKKAIFQNMIITIKNNKYGVLEASTGEILLENKYEEIQYLPTNAEFLIKSDGKYGIIEKDTSIKIKIMYDKIQIMDKQNGLYLVKKNNLYGIIDKDGQILIEPTYTQIGVDTTKYQYNKIENKYVLLDEIIPVKNTDGLWGIFNIKGEKIKDFEFTEIGCSIVNESNRYPAMVIPSYKILVVGKDGNYNLMTSDGELLIDGYLLKSVYIKSNTDGENKFYMVTANSEKAKSIEKWLTDIGR